MATRASRGLFNVKGVNPQNLVEKIIRSRIFESLYWKERCSGVNAELMVDRAVDLTYFGGVYAGNVKPTPFLCLVMKLLQLQPEKDIVLEYINQEDFIYLRALGALYIRLTFESAQIYKHLETLYKDYRKLKFLDRSGECSIVHMDEFIDSLLTSERYCDIQLPRLQKRTALEDTYQLDLYVSPLGEVLKDVSSGEESGPD